ncbi:MAG TPA: diacylglycerol kinase family protein [Pedobacter sp.]|nr:diacylglycerol kinase family protein [Pedobacter sp.]
MSKSNILFIINPISGGKNKQKLPALIDSALDRTKFNANFSFTEYVGHASEIAEEASNKNFDIIVAVGGDGTINEIAAKVMSQNKILGIVPFGSGNGLARFLKIPMNTLSAIKLINSCHVNVIDTGKFNEKHFFNMAGMGFDAHISSVFAEDKSRGLRGYLKLGLNEVMDYKAQTYFLNIDGVDYEKKAFVISIANSSQYGNNVHISPNASITDGFLDVCIVKEFPMYMLPVLGYKMIRKTTDKSAMVEIIRGREIKIVREKDDAIHIDGEPFFMGKKIDVSIDPLSLKIITPEV